MIENENVLKKKTKKKPLHETKDGFVVGETCVRIQVGLLQGARFDFGHSVFPAVIGTLVEFDVGAELFFDFGVVSP